MAGVVGTISSILGIAEQIYNHVSKIKENKGDCEDLVQRLQRIEPLLKALRKRGEALISEEQKSTLEELLKAMKEAEGVVQKYSTEKFKWFKNKADKYSNKFEKVNKHLNEAINMLQAVAVIEAADMKQSQTKMNSDAEMEAQDAGPAAAGTVTSTATTDAVDGWSEEERKEQFVVQNKAKLIQEVTRVMAIVEDLEPILSIHAETYAGIQAEKKSMEQMRILYTSVLRPGGRPSKVAFYDCLEIHEADLLKKLDPLSRLNKDLK